MRRIVCLAVAFMFIASCVPAFCGEGPKDMYKKSNNMPAKSMPAKSSSSSSSARSGKSIFQIASDDINSDIKMPKVREVNAFEKAKDYIAGWNESNKEMKSASLRGQKSEIARRRRGKL